MYSVHSNHHLHNQAYPQAAPIVIIQERRSVCARVTAFILLLFSSFMMISMILSVAVYMSMPARPLPQPSPPMDYFPPGGIDQELSQEPDVPDEPSQGPHPNYPTGHTPSADEIMHTVPFATEALVLGMETKPSMAQVFLRTWVRLTVATSVAIFILAMGYVLYNVYYAYSDLDAFNAEFLEYKDSTLNTVSMFFNEVSEGASRIFTQIVSFDYQGLFSDFLEFAMNVWAELKSYFEPRNEDVEIMEMYEQQRDTMDTVETLESVDFQQPIDEASV